MKVALLEASHWHVPLYLEPLEAPGIEVVAVSDAEQVKGPAVAARFGSTLYASSTELLDREKIDIGVVEGIVGIGQWEVTAEGIANHAGIEAFTNFFIDLIGIARVNNKIIYHFAGGAFSSTADAIIKRSFIRFLVVIDQDLSAG